MDLPDCPPGAEGYEDSVTEVPKKPDDPSCTKAEQEFQEHLNSLKIKLEDGTTRPMVERSGRDISGKWIYLCYPCAAVCSGESILQVHVSGKKHKSKLAMTHTWPKSIFEEHPYHQNNNKTSTSEKVLQKMAQAVDVHNQTTSDLENMFRKYRNVTCHIQESLDAVKAPLIGVEYLIEHPPEQVHYEPKYICTLCAKQGHPRTIINHMTCYWHRFNYLSRHFRKASIGLLPYRGQAKYRTGVTMLITRIAQRIEDTYGRMRPLNIDKEEYEKNKESIHQWIVKGEHFEEKEGCTFEEVADVGLIDSLHGSTNEEHSHNKSHEPSPPIVAAPSKPHFNRFTRPAGRQERRMGSVESLSDISDDLDTDVRREPKMARRSREMEDGYYGTSPPRSRLPARSNTVTERSPEKVRPPNYKYKIKLASDKRSAVEEFAKKTLAYHEKNPEKHPLYPEEWKKFWNKRYKEIQAEGKDPSKHDFKPEWIVFWTARMKELHDQELRSTVIEVYRKMCLTPPDMSRKSPERSPRRGDYGRRPDDSHRRSPNPRRRTPEPRRRSSDRRRSPGVRHRSSEGRNRSPMRRRSPDVRRDRRSRSPLARRSPVRHRSPERRRSPIPHRLRTRSRSPIRRRSPPRGARLPLDEGRRSRSPLSQREMQPRNRSQPRDVAPSMQTVLISDDELKADDALSPWNSDNEIGSAASIASLSEVRSRADSTLSRGSRATARHRPYAAGHASAPAPEPSAPDDVVATLRTLVALEDYLGSLGPKLVDLLAEALKMEKESANSSESLLVRESATVLIETAKEKLKGAAQAGLVTGSAAAAARAAVVRAAATLHEADKRARAAKKKAPSTTGVKSAVPVAGIGEVDRAQIAQQMAEALIAQGKTDVSSEELAQLVDAVVGMAEAKKREAERKEPEIQSGIKQKQSLMSQKLSGTASALQMLQSAYDEHDKRIEKEDTPDAMDGLSDSDLETLLKNFNELSAEEQHSLIAYLKKLEAREPTRVERLRQYVSEAAHAPAVATAPPAPLAAPQSHLPPARHPAPPQAAAPPKVDAAPVLLESDDDDYTVEEVFQSATQKVKEDQIRQEMEIVKKSLEEAKPLITTEARSKAVPEANTAISSILNITQNFSSASDLFALVQASLKSTATTTLAQPTEVVSSNIQPRSFGDLPEEAKVSQEISKPMAPGPTFNSQLAPLLRNPPQNLMDNRNSPLLPNDQNIQGNQTPNDRFNQSNQPNVDHLNQGNHPPNDNFIQLSQQSDCFNQGNQPPDRFNQGNQVKTDRFNQGNQPPSDHFNQGIQSSDRFKQGNQLPSDRFNQANQMANDRFNQDNQPPNDRFNRGNQPPNDRYNYANQPPNDRFNQSNLGPNDRFNQPPPDRFTSGSQPQNTRLNQGNQQQNEHFHPGMQPPDRFNSGNLPPNDRFNQGNQPQHESFDQGNQGNQWNARPNIAPLLNDNRGPLMRGPVPLLGADNFVPSGPYNQGPRPNFKNNRGNDNRQMNQQQYGNYDNPKRGRGGRGQGRGGPRGRGRGYY